MRVTGANHPAVLKVGSSPIEAVENAHDREGDDEGYPAPHKVADAPEEEGAERAHQKTDGERGQVGDQGEGVVPGRIELDRQNGGQRAEDVEVIPLDHGPGGGAEDHAEDRILFL